MQKTKEIRKEEKVFLRLCGESYRKKIMKREAFSLNEFQKLLYVITTLKLWDYMNYFLLEVYLQEMIALGDYLLSEPKEENSQNGLYAKKNGAQIYLVINDVASILSSYADDILIVPTDSMNFCHSTTALNVITEYLLTLISRKCEFKERIDTRDQITEDQRL